MFRTEADQCILIARRAEEMTGRAFTPEDVAAERARVALEWQLPQRSPKAER